MRIARTMGGFAAAVLLSLALPADAQLFRTYLSSAGSDANPCTRAAPCRLMPAALTAVADGGEIWMLDSANYNTATVSITKSVSVLAEPGAIGSLVATAGPAVAISGPAVKVALTNLVIVPLPGGGGTSGVEMQAATTGLLVIDKVSFSRLPSDGVYVNTNAAVRISNSSFVDLGNNGVSLAGNATAEISNVKMSYMQSGVSLNTVSGTTKATITDSTITTALNCGVYSLSSGGQSQAYLTRVTITNSNGGVCSQGGTPALVSLNQSTLQGNFTGVVFTDEFSKVATFGNNAIANNVTNILGGTMTAVALQ